MVTFWNLDGEKIFNTEILSINFFFFQIKNDFKIEFQLFEFNPILKGQNKWLKIKVYFSQWIIQSILWLKLDMM